MGRSETILVAGLIAFSTFSCDSVESDAEYTPSGRATTEDTAPTEDTHPKIKTLALPRKHVAWPGMFIGSSAPSDVEQISIPSIGYTADGVVRMLVPEVRFCNIGRCRWDPWAETPLGLIGAVVCDPVSTSWSVESLGFSASDSDVKIMESYDQWDTNIVSGGCKIVRFQRPGTEWIVRTPYDSVTVHISEPTTACILEPEEVDVPLDRNEWSARYVTPFPGYGLSECQNPPCARIGSEVPQSCQPKLDTTALKVWSPPWAGGSVQYGIEDGAVVDQVELRVSGLVTCAGKPRADVKLFLFVDAAWVPVKAAEAATDSDGKYELRIVTQGYPGWKPDSVSAQAYLRDLGYCDLTIPVGEAVVDFSIPARGEDSVVCTLR